MRQFQFTARESDVQATVVVDIIDPKTQQFTIMDIRGGKDNIFENRFPWKLGAVLFRSEIEDWYGKNQSVFRGFEYGGAEVVEMGSDNEKELTMTPDITGGDEVLIQVTEEATNGMKNTFNVKLESTAVKVPIYIGYKYSFAIVTEDADWTSTAPSEITCDGDESVTIAVTIGGDDDSEQ